MIAQRIVRLAVLLVVICASSAYAMGQQTAPSSPDRKNKIVYDGDMAALLSHLAAKFNVNIGLETDRHQPRPRAKIDIWYNTLEEILNAVVESAPGYRWRNQDGFIDVYPHEAGCPLLDTVIGDFRVDNDDWLSASEVLTNLPEVQSQMETMRLRRSDFVNTTRKPEASLFSMSLENVTLRRALHEITKKSGNGFWVFQRHGARSLLFSISNSV